MPNRAHLVFIARVLCLVLTTQRAEGAPSVSLPLLIRERAPLLSLDQVPEVVPPRRPRQRLPTPSTFSRLAWKRAAMRSPVPTLSVRQPASRAERTRAVWVYVFYATKTTFNRRVGFELGARREDDRVAPEMRVVPRGVARLQLAVGVGFEL